ncbi:hypothetical protein ACG1VR_14100 [Cedecea davisae]|uniref:hypothetical protein n=1 Tax=Cedecea davisae TaxID=158484 RepID=UPI00376F2ACA
MISAYAREMDSLKPQNKVEWENKSIIENSPLLEVKNVSNDNVKILIVGYSPTGGGHTTRILNVVEYALNQGSLPVGSQVYFHIPPRWESTARPALLKNIANRLVSAGVQVKVTESDKPVYGYLDEKTGSSNDPKILKRIALHPLRDKKQFGKNLFLKNYFPQHHLPHKNEIRHYAKDDDLEILPRISATNLFENIIHISGHSKKNIWILSDMDPGLQKAAHLYDIPNVQRVDQQNHSLLLKKNDDDSNLSLANAILTKVLDAREANISHIALGGKNTLIDVLTMATTLGIDEKSTLTNRKATINKVIFPIAKLVNELPHDVINGCVLKGDNVNTPDDIEKIVYVYAHKKTNIVAEHICKQLAAKNCHYLNKAFIFCGKNAVPGYNSMHLAYLADADGITTAGAGTSGEFVYLHRESGTQSNLLILPIENHNEQETIANTLQLNFPDYILRLNLGEKLEHGGKIDELIERNNIKNNGIMSGSGKLMNAISASESYVKQTYDILFHNKEMDEEISALRNIQRKMYNDQDMKATRHYLKLYFQLTTYLAMDEIAFPIEILFKKKKNEKPAIIFNSAEEINFLFSDNNTIMALIDMSSEEKVNKLPLFYEVKKLMTQKTFPPSLDKINALNKSFGHYMTTGF